MHEPHAGFGHQARSRANMLRKYAKENALRRELHAYHRRATFAHCAWHRPAMSPEAFRSKFDPLYHLK